MDTLEPLALTAQTVEKKQAAGRLPIMAFVTDVETERVLQETAGLIGRAVSMRGDIDIAIKTLSEQRSPQLLIVDISGIEQPLEKIYLLADVCEPGTNVVALGDHNDVDLFRELIDAGISNYLVKPLNREVLARVLAPKTPTNMVGRSGLKHGRVLSVIGARGGVGTTTVAANLAWHFANRLSRRVALVDLDLQNGDDGMLFNIKPLPGFRDALNNPLRLDALLLDRLMVQVGERLFVLGAEEPLADNMQLTPSAIDALLSVLRAQFHYIIIDVPRIPAPAYRRALEMADRRIIVVDPTMRSMRDGVRLAKLFVVEEEIDNRTAFVVNRVGEAGNRALPAKDIHNVLQTNPVGAIPFLPKLVTTASHHATAAASARGKFASAITRLADELVGGQQRRRWSFWRKR
jgi:pilus assembly protein CpaE